MKQTKKKVKCPNCGQPSDWSATNQYRPFCCQRCRLIDLGEWLNESHRIPSEDPYIPPDYSEREND